MDDTKEEVYNNVTEQDMVDKLLEKKYEILSDFAKAYLAETELLPSEIELVCTHITKEKDGIVEQIYSFRRKK